MILRLLIIINTSSLLTHIYLLHQSLRIIIIIPVLMELERLPVLLTHIPFHHHLQQIFLQCLQLVICFTMVIRQYRNSIVRLSCIRISSIIDQHSLTQIPVQNSQIFTVHSFWSLITMISEKSMMNKLIIWIKIIQHHICITRMRSCKNYYFKMLCQIF